MGIGIATDRNRPLIPVKNQREEATFFGNGGNGWWVIFPIVGLVFMLLAMSRMLGFWGRGPRRGTGMGPMGMMSDDGVRP